MKRRTLIIGTLGLAGMLGMGWLGWRESSRRAPQANKAVREPVSIEPDAQAFYAATLTDLDGAPQAMQQWLGKPLVVNFWATWCPPCVKEMPDLNRLASNYPKAQFVGVAIDTDTNVREFVQKVPVSYPIVIAGHTGTALVRALGNAAGGLPFTVLLKPDGDVQDVIMGVVDPGKLSGQIKRLLASSAV
jgi:thiol-disulfide isomerase/thioredoxin